MERKRSRRVLPSAPIWDCHLLRNTRKSWPPDRGWTGGFLRSLAPRPAALALLSAIALTLFSAQTPQQTTGPQRIPQFENDDVAVWKTTVIPNAPLTMHTHQHPRV